MQSNVWTFGAIGIQNAPDEGEEVTYSTFLNRRSNGSAAIPFTKLLTVDVRMGHRIVRGSGIRLQGNHAVRATVVQLVELVQLQLNLERPKGNIL